jgi:cell division protein FtsW
MVIVLVFLGGYPLKYIGIVMGAGLLALTFFILVAKAFPGLMPNRVDTWTSRIENFSNGEDTEADYQIEKAKIAIARGGVTGRRNWKKCAKEFPAAVIIRFYLCHHSGRNGTGRWICSNAGLLNVAV